MKNEIMSQIPECKYIKEKYHIPQHEEHLTNCIEIPNNDITNILIVWKDDEDSQCRAFLIN